MVSELDDVIADLRGLLVGSSLDADGNVPMLTREKLQYFALVLLLAALEVRDAWDQSGGSWERRFAN